MKLFLNDEDIDWEKVNLFVETLVDFDSHLRLNDEGARLRKDALNGTLQIFRPLVIAIANMPRDFRVYSTPVLDILDRNLIEFLKLSIRERKAISSQELQNYLIERLDSEERTNQTEDTPEGSDPLSLSEESWRLIHVENGFFEIEEINNFLLRIKVARKLSAFEEREASKIIEAGQFARERLEIKKSISDSERYELEDLVVLGNNAFELLFESSFSQLLSFALFYRSRGLTILELIQEGSLGLIRAIQKFDAEKGFRFGSYASWWIRQSMTRAIADSSSLIRIPVHRYEEIQKLEKIGNLFNAEKLIDLTDEERHFACSEMEISEKALNEIIAAKHFFLPLPRVLDKEGEFKEAFLSYPNFTLDSNNPEDLVSISIFEEQINFVLDTLTYRESLVIRARYGFFGHPWTLQEIGEYFGLTRERIRQIESKAISKLRHPSRSEVLKDYLDDDPWPIGYVPNINKDRVFRLSKEKAD